MPEVITLIWVVTFFIEDLIVNEKFNGGRNRFEIFTDSLLLSGILYWGGFFNVFSIPQVMWLFVIAVRFCFAEITITADGMFMKKGNIVKVLNSLFLLSLFYWGGLF